MVFANHPVINPHKPEKIRKMGNKSSKKRKFLRLATFWTILPLKVEIQIGMIFRFREQQLALSPII